MTVGQNYKQTSSNNIPHEDHQQTIETILGPEKDTLCGIGHCKGKFGQFLATPLVYLTLSSVIALIQGLFNTYSNATLSTVEKRYGLPSKLSGFTTTGNDLTQLLLSIPFAYYAGRGHRTRWLACGMLLAAVGCLIAASPHYLISSGRLQMQSSLNAISPLCGTNSTVDEQCDEEGTEFSSSHYVVVFIFLLAQMLSGVASLLYYTVGYSYLDDCVSKTKSPLFLSISGGLRLLGPVCGYALAAWSLRKWVNPWLVSSINIKPSHPGWVGAWWLGYLVIGITLLSLSWLLTLLPKTMPGTRRRRHTELQAASAKGPAAFTEYVASLRSNQKEVGGREFLSSMNRLRSNKVFNLVLLNQALFWFAFFGYLTFKSKYLEQQFRLSAADANSYIAGVSLVAALVGFLGTGTILSYFKPRPKLVLSYMAILSFTSMLCYVIQGSVYCDFDNFGRFRTQVAFNQSLSTCSENCNCPLSFSPVCDVSSSKSYLNACLAGCANVTQTNGTIEYYSCSCAENSLETEMFAPGYCPEECQTFRLYLVFSVIAKLAESASRVPLNMLLFRCVEERDKDLGLGVFNAVVALGASIPAPIFFGWLIDSTCTFWDSSCNESSHCWMYDITHFRSYLHGVPAAFLALCFLTDLWLLKHHKRLSLYSGDLNKKEDTL